METRKIQKIEDYHNFQKAKDNCLRSFYKKYKLTKDIDESIQQALDTAKVNNKILNLNPKHYKGLKGEIIFYGKSYESLDLDALKETGKTPADFYSPVTNKYYDVTTNLDYKDINDYIRNDKREYELAFVDIRSEEIELIPTSFPPCPKCGEHSHYVYFLDDSNKTEMESSIDYPSQSLVQYCWFCGYYKEIKYSNYWISSPKTWLEIEFPENDYTELEAKNFMNDKWIDISNLSRKNLMFSFQL